MFPVPWRRVLCIPQVVLAFALFFLYRAYEPWCLTTYKPAPFEYSDLFTLLYLPLLLVSRPLSYGLGAATGNAMVQLISFISFSLIFIGIFWYSVGHEIEYRLGSIPRPPPGIPERLLNTIHAVGLLCSAGILVYSIDYLVFGPELFFLGWLERISPSLWSAIFTYYFGEKLYRSRAAGKKNA